MEYHPAHTPLSLSKSNSVELLYNTRWATPTNKSITLNPSQQFYDTGDQEFKNEPIGALLIKTITGATHILLRQGLSLVWNTPSTSGWLIRKPL